MGSRIRDIANITRDAVVKNTGNSIWKINNRIIETIIINEPALTIEVISRRRENSKLYS